MALVNLARKTETLQGFELATRDDLWAALAWLSENGYNQGTVTFYIEGPVDAQTVGWQISVSDNYGTTQVGHIGDWIVLQNNSRATIHPPSVAAGLFDLV